MAIDEISIFRDQIDKLDRELWQILSERMDLTVQIKRLKNVITDSAREEIVLSKASAVSQGLLTGGFCETLMKQIVQESTRLQKEPLTLVSFRGLHGSFGELAVQKFSALQQCSNSAAGIPSLELSEVYKSVIAGTTDYAVVPLEGAVDETESDVLQLFIDSGLYMVAEVLVDVSHTLLISPGTSHRELQEAYSSVASLSRCSMFLKRNRLISKPVVESTAAAQMLARGEIDGSAVISNAYAASLYGLEILKDKIDDRANQQIRYVVVGKTPSKEKGNRCSVYFDISHHSGSLQEILEVFSASKINLLSIQSISSAKSHSSVSFTLDFKGSDKDEVVLRTLEKVAGLTSNLRMLGCYFSKAAE